MTRRRTLTTVASLLAFACVGVAAEAGGGRPRLPPETLRGPAYQLEQYPTPALATLVRTAPPAAWIRLTFAPIRRTALANRPESVG